MGGESQKAPGDARRLLASSTRVFAGRIAAYIASLGILVVTAKELGASGRGELVLIVTLVAFTTLVCSLGIPVAGRLLLIDEHEPVPLADHLGLAVLLSAVQGIVAPAIAAAFLPLADVNLEPITFFFIGVFAALSGFLYLGESTLMALGRAPAAAGWDAVGFAAQAMACAGLVLLADPGVTAFVAAFGLSLVMPVVGILIHLAKSGHRVRFAISVASWRRLVSTGWPSLGTVLSEAAVFRVDRLVLGVLATPSAVGVYSVGATAAEILRFVPTSVNALVFYEVVMRRIAAHDLRRIRLVTLGVMLVMASVGALIAPAVIENTLGSSFAGAVDAFRILLLSEFGMALYLLDSTILTSSRQVRLAALAALIGSAFILVTDMALIPTFAVAGAAWASVISYWAMAGSVRYLLVQARRRGKVGLIDDGLLAAPKLIEE